MKKDVSGINESIAEFMEWYKSNNTGFGGIGIPAWYNKQGIKQVEGALTYHLDWKLLMPVIEKICELKLPNEPNNPGIFPLIYPVTFGMKNEEGNFMFRFYTFPLNEGKTLIEAAYSAVAEVIEWYNREKELQKT